MATLVELQQEYVFLCGKEKGISFAELEIWSRLKPIYKAEKRARKAEKKGRKHGNFSSVLSEVSRAFIGHDFPEESLGDSEQMKQCLRDVESRLIHESSKIRERVAWLQTEIVRLGGVVPSCSF